MTQLDKARNEIYILNENYGCFSWASLALTAKQMSNEMTAEEKAEELNSFFKASDFQNFFTRPVDTIKNKKITQ